MKISNNCYAIHGLFTEAPWVVNSGFIVGDRKTLVVDTGTNYASAQTIFGYATCARPDNSLVAVNTEPHFDHTGGNCLFSEKGVPIYGHQGINKTQAGLEELAADLNKGIGCPVRKAAHEERTLLASTRPVNPDIKVSESVTQIDIGGQEVELILTPGHTPENLVVYFAAEKVVYSGDTVVEGYIPNMENSTVNGWHDWLGSIMRIEQIKPEILVPGHGRVLFGDEIYRQIEITREYLLTGIKTGKPPTTI